MKWKLLACTGLALVILSMVACFTSIPKTSEKTRKSIVVTYSVLGAIVTDLIGNSAKVTVLMPNGSDPHGWEPSARDIETLDGADLIIQNGLKLESGMQKTLEEAARLGINTFIASDYIDIRKVGEGEGIPGGDPDQAAGAEDPHLWTDPLAIKNIVSALSIKLKTDLAINTDSRLTDIETRLSNLNNEISEMVSAIPAADRKLVTGHESMGYFAQRYGFKLIGAIVPGITTQAEVSAANLAALKKLIEDNKVKAIFTELGTSSAVADAIGKETGVNVVQLTTHILPEDGSYFTFERNLATTVVNGLK